MPVTIHGVTYTTEEWNARIDKIYGPKGPPIPRDDQAIMALQKVSTGADVHDTNALISSYKSSCDAGRQSSAETFKRRMYERAIKLQKQSGK